MLRNEVVNITLLNGDYNAIVVGMLVALLASTTWLLLATQRGWPVSTTHSIVGAIAGFGVVRLGLSGVKWHILGKIGLSWFLAPIIAGFFAFALFFGIHRFVYGGVHKLNKVRLMLCLYMFLLVFVNLGVTLSAGLALFSFNLTYSMSWAIAAGLGGLAAICFWFSVSKKIHQDKIDSSRTLHEQVEASFKWLAILAACAMAYSHGSNDVANAIGPLSSIIDALNTGKINHTAPVPFWVLSIGVGGVIVGLALLGKKVIATIGTRITQLTPSRGFCVQLATSGTVVIASGLGIPVSTTQILVGALMGLGMARGLRSLNLRVVRSIFLSWVVTVPAGFAISVIYYYIINLMLNVLA